MTTSLEGKTCGETASSRVCPIRRTTVDAGSEGRGPGKRKPLGPEWKEEGIVQRSKTRPGAIQARTKVRKKETPKRLNGALTPSKTGRRPKNSVILDGRSNKGTEREEGLGVCML